jgi:O-antigen/teichoic acid export membrane protein
MKLPRLRVAAKSLAGETVRLAVGHGLGKVLSFVGFLLVARTLGPIQYGGFAFALSLGSLLIFIPNFGVDPLFSREVPAGRARPNELLGHILVVKTWASGLFLIVYLSVIFFTATSAPARGGALLIALAMTLLAFGQTWRTVLITSGRAGLAGTLEIVAASVFVLVSVGTLAHAPTVSGAALSFLSGQLAAGIVGAFLVLRLVRLAPLPRTTASYRRIVAQALPLMIIWFLSDLYLRIDMTILYYLRGDGQTGLYGASYRLVEGVYSGALVVCSVSLPRMAGAWSVGVAQWRQEWKRARRLVLLIVVPAAAILFIGAGPIIWLLYGPAFAGAAESLRVLGPATVFLCLNYIYGAALTSVGREWAQMGITVLALLLNVLLNVLWIPTYGGVGAAFATLVSALAYLLLAHGTIKRGLAAPRTTRAVEIPPLPQP